MGGEGVLNEGEKRAVCVRVVVVVGKREGNRRCIAT